MTAAEPARRVERLAVGDVVDALREDRLEVGGLGAPPLSAQRAPRRVERVCEVDVGAGAHAEAGHWHAWWRTGDVASNLTTGRPVRTSADN